jgi:hypothetical protein
LNHQEGDFDLFPIDLQEKACDFARNHIWPAVLVYLEGIFPSFCNFSVTDLEKEGLYLTRRVEGIPEELMYDLHQASRYLRPYRYSRKIDGKRYVGSYIRICNAIEKEDLGVQIRQIVEKCLTPHEYQDPKDSYRAGYGLKVEPSTGGIQCSCCKEKLSCL